MWGVFSKNNIIESEKLRKMVSLFDKLLQTAFKTYVLLQNNYFSFFSGFQKLIFKEYVCTSYFLKDLLKTCFP